MPKFTLIGTWRLVDSEFRLSERDAIHEFGRNAVGLLTYTGEGYVSLQIMRASQLPEPLRRLANDSQEFRAALDGFVAYGGRYRIDEKARTVTCDVSMCSIPSWVGHEQVRQFAFRGNQLIQISQPIPAMGQPLKVTTIWERITQEVRTRKKSKPRTKTTRRKPRKK